MSETRAISTTRRRELSSNSFFLQGKAPKEIHAILTETLACFLPSRAKDLSAPYLYIYKLRVYVRIYRGADKSLARPGRKQARKHVRDARDFNNIETRAVIKFLFPARRILLFWLLYCSLMVKKCLVREEDVFVPLFSVPLEETF